MCRHTCPLLASALFCLLLVVALLHGHQSLPRPGYTGGFGEANCTACHTGAVNPSGGSVAVEAASWSPARAVPVTVTIRDTAAGRQRWGFQLSARFRDGKQAGSFSPGSGVDVILGTNGIQYAGNAPAARQAGSSFTYTVMWTAPGETAAGDVLFSAAGMAADGDGGKEGDRTFTVQATATMVQPPRVYAGGIVNAASFVAAPNNAVAPGALISVFGENLADQRAEASSLPLPVTLGGTTLLVDGRAAPLLFVSGGQINAQAPFELVSLRTYQLVVTNSRGTSAPEPLRVDTVSPGIFTLSGDGKGPGAILHAAYSLVNDGAPARPGEIVLIFCTGLGQTTPRLETGKPGNGQPTLEMPVVTIGSRDAPVLFSGAAPGFAGLYQVNAVVPDLAAGSHEIILKMPAAGKTSQAGVTMRVQP